MADEARGDDVYQPENSDVDNGPSDDLDLENVMDERGLDEMMTEGYSPPERPLGVTKYGTTGAEQRAGESLDQRLDQEVPDVAPETGDGVGDVPGGEGEPRDAQTGGERAGRLEPVIDIAPRRHSDVSARDVGIDGGAASAEEAAVHLSPDEDTSP
ncbi:DUF5709 domain-containing protein [Streptomyces sp. NBC_01498]|uniref:DUF5709 domain-containing protein n=1 Tax=Streptomyces sp. NBC_01498 TaxID=2975870 RepID=UPI002E7B0332|nr:DUF5709 domain-containing protein [Streptomyces sp. NBC_01498]WTL23235.1 DUF5709 domain-containing protein [Streptomyces sp. NBC_01498]